MALILEYIDHFHLKMDEYGDPRTNSWFLMSSPFPTLLICLSYVYLVKVLGPRLMENRKPFELKNVLIVYNLFQVIFSAWLFHGQHLREQVFIKNKPTQLDMILVYIPILFTISGYGFIFFQIAMSGWFTGRYSLQCQPVDYSKHPETLRMVDICWWYYFSKFTEFFDTIFFVLRKKYEQTTTLHVIHHGVMPMSVWFGVKFTPGGHSTFFGLLNTFVHIIMYSYYLLAAMGPSVRKFLWWKKYLTALQMTQFIAIMVHAFQLLFIDCNYPRAFVWWIGMHAVMFYFLFSDFYKKAYIERQRQDRLNQAAALSAQESETAKLTKEVYINAAIKNGFTNGHANSKANGLTNGSANGLANGSSNGMANGASNGLANGHSTAAYLRTRTPCAAGN